MSEAQIETKSEATLPGATNAQELPVTGASFANETDGRQVLNENETDGITGNAVVDDESTPNKKPKLSNDANDGQEFLSKTDSVSPAKGPGRGRGSGDGSKRLSILAKTAQEGEALLKELGHSPVDDNPDSNRRRTRSQTRGVPPPPPVEKTPRGKKDNDVSPPKKPTGSGRRGRPPKNANAANAVAKPQVSTNIENNQNENETNETASAEVNNTDTHSGANAAAENGTEVANKSEEIKSAEPVPAPVEHHNDSNVEQKQSIFDEAKPISKSDETPLETAAQN